MNTGLHVVFGLAPFVLACDPALSISGSVHATDDAPISGATVRTVCPDEGTYGDVSTKTRTDGTFSAECLGSVNDECRLEVVVSSDGSTLQYRYPALDYCTDGDDVSCTTLKAHVVVPLAPE